MGRVQVATEQWTIVRDVGAYKLYELHAISPELRELVQQEPLMSRHRSTQQLLVLLECYLQLTGQTLSISDLARSDFVAKARGFVGALYSKRFWLASDKTRYAYASSWRALLAVFRKHVPVVGFSLEAASVKPSTQCLAYAKEFDRTPLNPDATWLWRGWRTENLNGEVRWLKLYPMAKSLGRDFTQRYYEIADTWFSAGRAQYVEHVELIADYLSSYPGISRAKLQATAFCQQLLQGLATHFITEKLKKNRPDRVSLNWRVSTTQFIEQHLIPAGMLPEGVRLPTLPHLKIVADGFHLGVDEKGGVRIEKLLIFGCSVCILRHGLDAKLLRHR